MPSDIGDAHYDDPSLALLFSQLKMKTLQTAKGTSEISGRTEFNFVLQTARVFVRMGRRLSLYREFSHDIFQQVVTLWPWALSETGRSKDHRGQLPNAHPRQFAIARK